MKKKFAMVLLILILMNQIYMPLKTYAQAEPSITAKNAYVMDCETDRCLYEKNSEERVAMASTTKIMTAIITLENANLDDMVTVSKNAASIGGSVMYLSQGEVISVRNLLYGLMLPSGNDAAIALAEFVGGSVEAFCRMMNLKSIQLGAKDTSFTSPHGLDDDYHYTTAKDLAVITKYALGNSTFREIVATKSINAGGHSLRNTNDLLFSMDEVDGVKTGFTGKAGRCMVLTAIRNNHRVIIVILGCPTAESRSNDGKKLVEYSLSNFSDYTVVTAGDKFGTVNVLRGVAGTINAKANENVVLTLTDDERAGLKIQPILISDIKAPVEADTVIGRLEITSNGSLFKQIDLVASESSRKKDFLDYMGEIMGKWAMVSIWNQLK
ncbi:MAG: D-alanyl-D-alanine carboxypeptidase [Clostridiales bacterium]|jgi:D-alanyl-D-alanine carboxypeptidase (penicillin-binding protein 5/6)|nr:D-alanyl-D-alanine carboxypeptidase [Clostridiales bacterium]